MRRFFLRELLRLAPVALATAFLGVLVYVGLAYLAPGSWAHGAGDHAYLIVLLGAPWLLGAAAIAPDAESGALTFMATLPVRGGRQLAARVGAALLYALLVPALAWLVLQPESAGQRPTWFVFAPEALFGLAFLGALLASATIRNALAAFMLTPVLVGLPLAGILELGIYWQWKPLIEVCFMGLTLCVAAGAWAAFVHGDHYGRLWSPRTLRLGLSVALAPVLLLAGLSSAVSAYDWTGRWVVAGAYREAGMTRELVQLRKVRRLTGGEYDAEPGVWCVRDGAGLVPLGEGRGPGPVSPDGRWLISLPAAWWTRGEAGVELIDLTGVEPRRTGTWATGYQGTPTGAAVPFDLEQERSPASQYAHAACWWDQPYRAVPGGLRGLDGSLVPWPQVLTGEPEVLAVGGASVLLRDAVGEWAWDRDGVRRLPACDDEAAAGPWRVDAERWLSPRGRWVLAWAQRTDVPTRLLGSALADVSLARPARLVALDLAQGASARWQTLWESAREQAELVRYWGAFSPGEDYLVLGADEPGAASESDEMTYQLIRLSDAARPLGSHPSQGRPLWTPAGELVLLGEGYVTFADGEPELHDWPSACRAGGRRIAESPPYLRVIRAESGLRLLCDGEDWELLRLDLRDPAAEQVVPRDLGADLPF